MKTTFAKIAFTPNVLKAQKDHGSDKAYASFLEPETEAGDTIGPAEAAFLSGIDGFYQATVSETGWPYVQFRGGPKGFLQALDEKTLAYADFRGNRQYISVGNLSGNNRITLILMDYPNQRRLKIWGHVQLVTAQENPELINRLHPSGYRAAPERAVLITVDALSWNCPQHIPQRMTLEELEPHLAPLRQELARLQHENAQLKKELSDVKA